MLCHFCISTVFIFGASGEAKVRGGADAAGVGTHCIWVSAPQKIMEFQLRNTGRVPMLLLYFIFTNFYLKATVSRGIRNGASP
jgi:hypothetical protein